mgnify:CR=1 FL=1
MLHNCKTALTVMGRLVEEVKGAILQQEGSFSLFQVTGHPPLFV